MQSISVNPKSIKRFVVILMSLLGGLAPLYAGSTTTILSVPAAAMFGGALTLTATVSPSSATGKVSFYDGDQVLGTSMLANGVAVKTVHLYTSGKRRLVAYYAGDAANNASTSGPAFVRINSQPSSGFIFTTVDLGLYLYGIAVGDFNGDGKADLVGVGSSNIVKTVLGNGDGTFGSPIPSLVGGGTQIRGVIVTDFDGDGKADIVIGVSDEAKVKVLFGNGDGTFSGVITLPVALGAIAVGDFNMDGSPDLAVADSSSGTIQIVLGNGNRTFQAPVSFPAPKNLPGLLVGDLNNDGRPDLVTVAPPVTGDVREVVTFLGNGDGSFSTPQTLLFDIGLYSPFDLLALEDLDGDSNLDLVIGCGATQFATVLRGNGDGSFAPPVLYHSNPIDQGSTLGLAVVDVDGDGRSDIVIDVKRTNSTTYELEVYTGNGNATFASPPEVFFAPTADNHGLVTADFDGDGRVDFASMDDGPVPVVRIFHGAGLPVLRIAQMQTTPLIQGQSGYFSLTISNAGQSATSGTITVSQTFSTNLTLQSMSGTGWNCSGNNCSRSDSLAPASSFAPITVSVNVAAGTQGPEGGDTTVTGTGFSSPELEETFGIIAPNCSYALGSQNASFGPTSNSASVTVITTSGCPWAGTSNVPWIVITSGHTGAGNGTLSYTVASNTGSVSRSGTIFIAGQTFTVTQTPGTANPGIFRSGFFWLEDVDGNQQFNSPPDRAFAFGGVPGDIPISGDWNGSGTTKVGVYRPSNGLFVLDYDGDGQFTAADKAYNLGVGTQAGDVPVVGDWNGDGKTKVGLFRQGFFWILDTNGNGTFEQGLDQTFAFGGVAGDLPVVGDWNGDGRSKLGLFRQGFFWILDYNGNGSIDNVNGAGGDKAFAFGGLPGDVPVVGDWNGDGTSKVGVFRSGFFWVLDANGNYQFDGTGVGQDLAFPFGGINDDKPVVGKW
jgi:hypothetical protein